MAMEIESAGATPAHPAEQTGGADAASVTLDAAITVNFAEATRLAILAIDYNGNIAYANPAVLALFGYSREEMIGHPVSIIIPERLRAAHTKGFARAASGAKLNLGGRTVEVSALRKDGTEFPIEITLSVWRTADGMFAGAFITDITERRERDTRLLRLASQDTLTGLHNRHRFTDLLQETLDAGVKAGLFILDLNGFGELNDMHGYATGDSLLQAVGVRLPTLFRAGTEVARFGADEFAILVPSIGDAEDAERQASALLDSFSTPVDVEDLSFELTASVGYLLTSMDGADAEELIACADFALHRAKTGGRQTSAMYNHSMRDETQVLRETRDELRRALRLGELELFYQPQVSLADGEVNGLEALIRWNHPERGLLPPYAFLPAAEQSSLALDIGWWTLNEACRQLSDLREAGYRHLKVGVNLFAAQVRAPNLVLKVRAALEQHALDPALLEIEVTETIALNDDGRSLEALAKLRALGVRIAFDDFGTGFASLSSLQRYPLTTLKIDRSFVQDLASKPSDVAIIRALVSMSTELGLDTIAEGIETPEQAATIRALGCSNGQGFLYARPMPAPQLLAFLARTTRYDRFA